MDADSRERVKLIFELKKTLREDHNARGGSRFSEDQFQKDLEDAYPRVGTSVLLSTARIYNNDLKKDPSKGRGFDHDKLESLINFIFIDHGHLDWPRTRQTIKNFAGGKYAHLIRVDKDERVPLSEEDRVRAGATPGQSESVQLLELHMLAVKENDEKMIDKIERLQYQIKEAKEEGASLRKDLKDLIDTLESKLEQLTPEQKKKLSALKTKL